MENVELNDDDYYEYLKEREEKRKEEREVDPKQLLESKEILKN